MTRKISKENLDELAAKIHLCTVCSRLRNYCLEIAQTKRKSYQNDIYWGKPISGFGDLKGKVLIVGLAPAAHGANRTGRIFTGDRSGDWLFRALHKAGFANQPTSTSIDDGLLLKNVFISCMVKCAPPDNKPLPIEVERCGHFLKQELERMPQVKVYIALGQLALAGLWTWIGNGKPRPKFGHGLSYRLSEDKTSEDNMSEDKTLLLSYHPSQQNTFTGRLTEPMFDQVFTQALNLLK